MIFTLPSPSLISTRTSYVETNSGFLHNVFQAMTSYPNEERDINIVTDVMSTKTSKSLDHSSGKFIGHSAYIDGMKN